MVFRDGKPSRKEYRHFNIKTVIGADDFASMREIVFRRYSRLIAEGAELPDLIIVDGGKGQLSSAYAVLCELGIEKQVPIVGLAKRIEEIFFPGDPMPYYLSRTVNRSKWCVTSATKPIASASPSTGRSEAKLSFTVNWKISKESARRP